MSLLAIIGFCALNLGLFAQNLSNSLDHTAQLGGVSSFKKAPAEIVLPRIYTDNMVLQHNSTVTIPGTTAPGAKVTLTADWLTAPVLARADRYGKFSLKFNTPVYGWPYTKVLNDGYSKKILQNILIGEVWLCSGQSNMEFPIRGDWVRVMDADEVVATMQRPALRLLQIKNTTSLSPLDDASVEYGWMESSPAAELKEDFGKRAVMRGPLVYCMEECDNPTFDKAAISSNTVFSESNGEGILKGFKVLHTDSDGSACSFIPYFAWDNRKSGKMKVWIDLVESERKQSQHSNR